METLKKVRITKKIPVAKIGDIGILRGEGYEEDPHGHVLPNSLSSKCWIEFQIEDLRLGDNTFHQYTNSIVDRDCFEIIIEDRGEQYQRDIDVLVDEMRSFGFAIKASWMDEHGDIQSVFRGVKLEVKKS
jgi:hypothetical protein